MMTYQLGVDFAKRFAAIVPQFGSFAIGFNKAPAVGVPLLEFHGTHDFTIPANHSLAADGWMYATTEEIFHGNKYSGGRGWKDANNCSGEPYHYKTSYDGRMDFWCVAEGECSGGDLVRCAWDGGHNWLFNDAVANGKVVTDFLLQWAKPAHLGKGISVHDELDTTPTQTTALDVTIVKTEDLTFSQYVSTTNVFNLLPHAMTHGTSAHNHADHASAYGNPKHGCRKGSEVVRVGTGHACAPRITVTRPEHSVPVPDCTVGGSEGCPHYAGEAKPVCLAKRHDSDTSTNPYTEGEFHCVLECRCELTEKGRCADKGDTVCPRGSACELGEFRHRAKGVCTYTKE